MDDKIDILALRTRTLRTSVQKDFIPENIPPRGKTWGGVTLSVSGISKPCTKTCLWYTTSFSSLLLYGYLLCKYSCIQFNILSQSAVHFRNILILVVAAVPYDRIRLFSFVELITKLPIARPKVCAEMDFFVTYLRFERWCSNIQVILLQVSKTRPRT